MGAQTEYTYISRGITQGFLNTVMPGTGTAGQQVPPTYHGVTWDADFKDDLDAVLAEKGWEFLWVGPPPPAVTVAQIQSTVLGADTAAIVPADGWVTVVSRTIDTRGGSTIAVQASVCSESNGSGTPHMRIIVNCPGIFTDVVVGSVQNDLAASDHGGRTVNAPRPIAATSPDINTYTFAVQFSVTGGGSSILARAGSVLTLAEHRA